MSSSGSGTIAAAATPGSGYATLANVADWTGTDVGSLPSDASRLILRASELIDHVTGDKIDVSDTSMMAAACSAACAQVEFWIRGGEGPDFRGIITSGSMVNIMQVGGDEIIAPRARRMLMRAGLLYAGLSSGQPAAINTDKFTDDI